MRKTSKKVLSSDAIRFEVKSSEGLSYEQVEERVSQGLTNKTKKRYSKSYWEIIVGNVFTFFNILLFIIAGAQIAVGYFEGSFFLLILFSNMFFGLFQDIKAKKTMEKLRLVTSPSAQVIRESKEITIKASEVVLDDVISLCTGKQICADSVVLEGKIEVNESMLTGESIAVKKEAGDKLFAGSFVVSGKAFAQTQAVGVENYIEQLQSKAKTFKRPKSELLRSMNYIFKIISYFIVPLGIGIAFVNYKQVPDIAEVVKYTSGALIGMIPSGMFLLTSMTLSVGFLRLVKRKTLAQELYSIEMLARVNIICFDKTGTLTDGTMNVKETKILPDFEGIEINEVMGSFLSATADENQTANALKASYPLNNAYKSKTVIPFSSERKYSAVTFTEKGTFILGAPEFVCSKIEKSVDEFIKNAASRGLRVLLLAYSKEEIKNDIVPKKVDPVALFVIQDHIREEAYDTIAWFKNNDVKIKIISGDNPITVSEIAKQCGVDEADKYINLEGMSNEEVAEIVDQYIVFGRVSPDQKAVIVQTLRERKNVVAMTGDGVNDILALKHADCSVAMASGSEATQSVSHLVLLDSNFANMPRVVEEGRRVINNLQNTASLFLVKTTFTVLLSIVFLIAGLVSRTGSENQYPFVSGNLYIWEIGAIGVASFFLALQPNTRRINGGFVDNVVSKAIPGGLVILVSVCIAFALQFIPNITGVTNSDIAVTISVFVMSFMGFVVLFRICMPFNRFRVFLFSTVLILTIICTIVVQLLYYNGILKLNLLAIYPELLKPITVVIGVCICLVAIPLYIWFERIFTKYVLNRRKNMR